MQDENVKVENGRPQAALAAVQHPDNLTLYLLGDLPEAEAGIVRAHLAACAECRVEAQALEQTIAVLRAAYAAAPPAPVQLDARHRRFKSRWYGPSFQLQLPRPSRRLWQNLLAAAASLVLLLGTAGIFLLNRVTIIGRLSSEDAPLNLTVTMPECGSAPSCMSLCVAPDKAPDTDKDSTPTDRVDDLWTRKSDSTIQRDMLAMSDGSANKAVADEKPSVNSVNVVGYTALAEAKKTQAPPERSVAAAGFDTGVGFSDTDGMAAPGAAAAEPTAVMTKSPLILKGLYANRGSGGARAAARRAYGGGGMQAPQSPGPTPDPQAHFADEPNDITVTMGGVDGRGLAAAQPLNASENLRPAMRQPSGETLGALVINGGPGVSHTRRAKNDESTSNTDQQQPMETYEPRKLEHRVKDAKTSFQPAFKAVSGSGTGGGLGMGVSQFNFFGIRGKDKRTSIRPPSNEPLDTTVAGELGVQKAEATPPRKAQQAIAGSEPADAAQAQPCSSPLLEKMRKIVIPELNFREANIRDIVDFLNKACREGDQEPGDPNRKGAKLVLNLQPGGTAAPQNPFEAVAPTTGDADGMHEVTFNARFISLEQALKTITQVAGLKYSVVGNDVVIESADAGTAAKGATDKQEQAQTIIQAEPPAPAPPPFDVPDINPWTPAAQTPRSTFAMDVDTASYALCRNYLRRGVMPSAGFVRPEEFVNAFDYAYPPPASEAFSIQAQGAPSPFRPGVHLLSLGVQGRRLGRENKPAALTLVVDTSGSMALPDRLPLVKQALRMLIEGLQPADRVALVAFDAQPRLALEATPASNKKRLLAAVDALQASGLTDLEAALRLGYATAARGFIPGAANRVLLLSDGVANLGAGAADEILASVERYRKQGLTLSVFGFGLGTFDDRMLATLAARGNGNYHYLDSAGEARRVLVEDLTATLHTMAADAKIQVEFNPRRVTQYRQIGYEPRRLRDEDFRNDAIVAGEVGSGQSATCLYELRLEGDPREPVATVRVRYRDLESGRIVEIEQPVGTDAFAASADRATPRFRLAACASEFAELLRGSPYVEGSAYADVARVLRPVAMELTLDRRVRELLQLVTAAPGCARVEE